MPEVASDLFVEPHKREKNLQKELDRLKRQAILFIKDNPTVLFARQYNAERQAFMEFAFSEQCVENPEAKKEKLRGYCF